MEIVVLESEMAAAAARRGQMHEESAAKRGERSD
jgi:hypothetical protein